MFGCFDPKVFEWCRHWAMENFKVNDYAEFSELARETSKGKINSSTWRHSNKRIEILMRKYIGKWYAQKNLPDPYSGQEGVPRGNLRKSLKIATRFTLIHELHKVTGKPYQHVLECLPKQSREFLRVLSLVKKGIPVAHFGFQISASPNEKCNPLLTCRCNGSGLNFKFITTLVEKVHDCCLEPGKVFHLNLIHDSNQTRTFFATTAPNRVSITTISHKKLGDLFKRTTQQGISRGEMASLSNTVLKYSLFDDCGYQNDPITVAI